MAARAREDQLVVGDLSAATLHGGLTARYIGRDFRHLQIADSTQNIAASLGQDGAAEGLVVSADEQTDGRGRFKRTWVSPPASSLLLSILLRPPAEVVDKITVIAALAVARAITVQVPVLLPEIKWPNDILINGRKVCGILAEAHGVGTKEMFVILGIGLNVNWDTSQVPEIAQTATSLTREAPGVSIPRLPLLQRLLEGVEAAYEDAKRGDDVLGQWRERLVTIGRRVRVTGSDVDAVGIAEEVDQNGALLLRTDAGALLSFRAGDVSVGS
ncbi:MAG: biotin--[acetyl-CoA-carboxylase] ligase [Chloroflexi bacterium]|nr:biotin--[acetyl-CoA-carboxylase] ligase [Chloroflexota bacterium]